MENKESTTLEEIHKAAKAEFMEKGYAGASLRNIVKSVGMTTGAFYGYYDSKAALFGALVGKHYDYILSRFKEAQDRFAALPKQDQMENMSNISGECMFDMLHYAYKHLDEFKLILLGSFGTRYCHLIDEMVDMEIKATDDYMKVLEELGQSRPDIDTHLEHIIITGMFNTFFELIIHEMPLSEAEKYLKDMRAFYTAGWMKLLGS